MALHTCLHAIKASAPLRGVQHRLCPFHFYAATRTEVTILSTILLIFHDVAVVLLPERVFKTCPSPPCFKKECFK